MAPAVKASVTKAKGKTEVTVPPANAPDPQKVRQFMSAVGASAVPGRAP